MKAVNEIEPKAAGLWTRFFARTLDYNLWSCVFWFVFGPTQYGKNFVKSVGGDGSAVNMTFFLLFMPVYFVIDSFISAAFKNNIGNKIAGISIVRKDNLPDGIRFYLIRNLLVWFKGFGMCLPIVCNIMQMVQFHYTRKNSISSWDRFLSSYVDSGKSNNARNVIVCLLIACLCSSNFLV